MDILRPVITSARHEVAPGELFFSTTDSRGRILQANSVFTRMSRYRRDQLVGQPHNIIRHDCMPGGAFQLMWDTLHAGRPFCAYVDNLAATGSTYSVFATITPLGDGYLSVRNRPGVDRLRSTAFSLYGQVRPYELALRDEGLSTHDAAQHGLGTLAGLLADAGLTYEQFMWTALPAEVDVVLQNSISRTQRPDARGPLKEILNHVATTRADLLTWTTQMVGLQAMSEQLSQTATLLMQAVAENRHTSEQISSAPRAGFDASVIYLRVWADIAELLEPIFTRLAETLNQLNARCSQTRFRIALALLHVEALTQFVNEALDEGDYSEGHRISVLLLVRALDEGLQVASSESQAMTEMVALVTADISAVADLISMPQSMITTWLRTASATKDGAELISTVTEQRAHTDYAWQRLNDLITQAQQVSNPLNVNRARSEIDAVRYWTSSS